MQPFVIPFILLGYLFASATSAQNLPFSDSSSDNLISNSLSNPQQQFRPSQPQQLSHHFNFQKRPSERYGFGLGRRAFSYTSGNSGVKRLPVYNFGLGKRGGGAGGNGGEPGGYGGGEERRPYSFGLGKRAGLEMNEDEDSQENTQSVGYETWQMNMPQQSELTHAFDGEVSEKRARPYSFGLGKRLARIEEASSVERRGGPNRYNFGLGRR